MDESHNPPETRPPDTAATAADVVHRIPDALATAVNERMAAPPAASVTSGNSEIPSAKAAVKRKRRSAEQILLANEAKQKAKFLKLAKRARIEDEKRLKTVHKANQKVQLQQRKAPSVPLFLWNDELTLQAVEMYKSIKSEHWEASKNVPGFFHFQRIYLQT
ncbi:hypothetical protein DFJ73DRAFT_243790 [Zopfochytrium polystomum]|nr:hypothetical protein DFJ73DRAFT_243790 [Zopfochytrium polystomum]